MIALMPPKRDLRPEGRKDPFVTFGNIFGASISHCFVSEGSHESATVMIAKIRTGARA